MRTRCGFFATAAFFFATAASPTCRAEALGTGAPDRNAGAFAGTEATADWTPAWLLVMALASGAGTGAAGCAGGAAGATGTAGSGAGFGTVSAGVVVVSDVEVVSVSAASEELASPLESARPRT